VKPEIDLVTEENVSISYEKALYAYLETLVNELGEPNWEMSLTLCGNDRIADLNREFRGKEGPTDVLTFVMEEGEEGDLFFPDPTGHRSVGDIVVSLEKVKENSRELGIPYEEELKRVILHGILHLKGMTHEGYDWEQGMLREQETLLKKYKDIGFAEENETFLD
jgi:probable rRNA maturation factor